MPKGKASKPESAKEKAFKKEQERRVDVGKRFAKAVVDRHKGIIKSVVLWGSTVRGDFTSKSDLDFIVLIDDTMEPLAPQKRDDIDDSVYDISKKVEDKYKIPMNVQPVWTITEFVNMTRTFNPLAYAVLKSSYPLYDTGFFMTHKRLLEMGMITATPESSMRRWGDVPRRIERAKSAKLWLIAEDLYYALIGAEEAVMMYLGKHLPHPIHASKELKRELIDTGLLDQKYLKILDDVIEFRKKVEHKEIVDIDSKEIDHYIKETEDFVKAMEKLLMELEISRKKNDIQRAYEAMIRASVEALKALKKLPEDPKDLPKAFKKHLVDERLVSPFYYEVLDRVLYMKSKANQMKAEEVSERELTLTTEYVRRFIGEVGMLYKKLGIKPETVDKIPDVKSEDKGGSSKKKDKDKKRQSMTVEFERGQKEEKKDEIKEHTTA